MTARLQSVFNLFQGSRENAGKQVASKTFQQQGTKRAPLENIGNKATKKLVLQKSDNKTMPVAANTSTAATRPSDLTLSIDDSLAVTASFDLPNNLEEIGATPMELEAIVQAPEEPVELQPAMPTEIALPEGVLDIDSPDINSPEYAVEYVMDIMAYMRSQESRNHVRNDYLVQQNSFTSNMRATLVDWLIKVHAELSLSQETMYLMVVIIDRFMKQAVVPQDKIQLVGITSLLIASKYQDTYPPAIKHLCRLTEDAYDRFQVTEMEILILRALDFDLGAPLSLEFLRRGSRAAMSDCYIHGLSKYLLELTLPHAIIMNFVPSMLAAAALHISRCVFKQHEGWTATIEFYTGYELKDLQPCIDAIHAVLKDSETSQFQAVRRKWSHANYFRLSKYEDLLAYIAALP